MKSIDNSNIFQYDISQIIKENIDYEEYYLIKENKIYKFIVGKNISEIFIKCKKYIIRLNKENFSNLFKKPFISLDNVFDYIRKIFDENEVEITNIIKEKQIKLLIKKDNELSLLYNGKNCEYNNYIIKEIKLLRNEIVNLKKENDEMKKEIRDLKIYIEKNHPKFAKLIKTKEINDSYSYLNIDNTFTTFNSINNILYLIYSSFDKSIICYDLINQNKINEIKNCHNNIICNLRHYLDDINKRDLIMSLSYQDNNLKIWNVNNWDCIFNLKVNNVGLLYSACILEDKKENYIITSNRNKLGIPEKIKVFDFSGNKIKEFNNSNDQTFFIDIYYDKLLCENYIITGNVGHVKSYDYKNNKVYNLYKDNNYQLDKNEHISLLMDCYDEKLIKLIESSNDGYIRIWNFHSALLLNKIEISNQGLNGLCFIQEDYIFVACEDKTIKLIEINEGKILTSLKGHNKEVITIKKIFHPKFGDCLISQGFDDSPIILWINK